MTGAGAAQPPAPAWRLPDLMVFAGGSKSEWLAYEQSIYDAFCEDLVVRSARWRGLRVTLRYEPSFQDKGNTFWHCVTQVTPGSETRDPDLRRCERVRWIRALLEAPADEVRTWPEWRDGAQRMIIAPPDYRYLVVIRPIPSEGRAQLITAFYVESAGRREKYRREYDAAIKELAEDR